MRFQFGVAGIAVFAAAAGCIHGVLEVDNDFKAVVLQALNRLRNHEQIFFRRSLQRLCNIEQSGLDHHHRDRDTLPVGDDEFYVGPFLDVCAAPAGPAEQGEIHAAGIDRS